MLWFRPFLGPHQKSSLNITVLTLSMKGRISVLKQYVMGSPPIEHVYKADNFYDDGRKRRQGQARFTSPITSEFETKKLKIDHTDCFTAILLIFLLDDTIWSPYFTCKC